MTTDSDERRAIERELRRLGDELHGISVREKDLGKWMGKIEMRANAAGAMNIEQAIRRSFIRLTEAGSHMAEVHLDLTVPPTVFHSIAAESSSEDQAA